jgi:hypothetical protein
MIVAFHKAESAPGNDVYVNATHVTHFEKANPEGTHTIIHFDNGDTVNVEAKPDEVFRSLILEVESHP